LLRAHLLSAVTIVFLFLILMVSLHIYLILRDVQIQGLRPVEKELNVYDYRGYGYVREVKFEVFWVGYPHQSNKSKPLEGVELFVLDRDLTIVSEYETDENGIAHVYAPIIRGSYYVKLEYDAYFEIGGVEIVRVFFIFNFDRASGREGYLPFTLSPKIWSDEPGIEI